MYCSALDRLLLALPVPELHYWCSRPGSDMLATGAPSSRWGTCGKDLMMSYSLYLSSTSIAGARGQTAMRWQQALPVAGEGDPHTLGLALDIKHLSEFHSFRSENRAGFWGLERASALDRLRGEAAGSSWLSASTRVGAGRKPSHLVSRRLVSNCLVSMRLINQHIKPINKTHQWNK